MRSMLSNIAKTLAAASLVAVTGCGTGYEGLTPVSGTVTFDGAPPPGAGFLSFIPTERVPGQPSRPGRAVFLADGVYKATSFQEGDGLFPGSYTVLVTCNKEQPDYSKKDPFREASYVADGYEGQKLVVEEGSDEITLDLDVPLKK